MTGSHFGAAPKGRGSTIHLDRETGVWEKDFVLATCRTMQAHDKTIMLWGELDADELRAFQNELDPRGLAINYWESARAYEHPSPRGSIPL